MTVVRKWCYGNKSYGPRNIASCAKSVELTSLAQPPTKLQVITHTPKKWLFGSMFYLFQAALLQLAAVRFLRCSYIYIYVSCFLRFYWWKGGGNASSSRWRSLTNLGALGSRSLAFSGSYVKSHETATHKTSFKKRTKRYTSFTSGLPRIYISYMYIYSLLRNLSSSIKTP